MQKKIVGNYKNQQKNIGEKRIIIAYNLQRNKQQNLFYKIRFIPKPFQR